MPSAAFQAGMVAFSQQSALNQLVGRYQMGPTELALWMQDPANFTEISSLAGALNYWAAQAPPPPIGITVFDVAWGDSTKFFTNNIVPFVCNTIAVRFVAPVTSGFIKPGLISVAENQGGPALRQLTLSPNPGDFNAFIMAQSAGVEASIYFGTSDTVLLVPGQSYYFNMRNYDVINAACSCNKPNCSAVFDFKWPT